MPSAGDGTGAKEGVPVRQDQQLDFMGDFIQIVGFVDDLWVIYWDFMIGITRNFMRNQWDLGS